MSEASRRATDKGWLCWLALRSSQLWDFIDERDIDKHAMAWAVFWMTCYVTKWALDFVWIYPDKSGIEVSAQIAAVMVPWSGVQAIVIKWYFESRTGE